MLTAGLISRLAGQEAPPASRFPAASGAAFHSGLVRPGDVFFALPGAAGHGLQHAAAALEAGAAFIVSDRPHPAALQAADPARVLLDLGRHARSRLQAEVIAISGSAGKTTTKGMLAQLLDIPASPGNFNTPLALACTLVHAWLHTPDRPLIVELGIDHPGEMQQLLDLTRPTHALLTSIGASHLEGLGSISTVASEKRQLLDAVAPGRRFASLQAAAQLDPLPAGLITYGLDPAALESAEVLSERTGSQVLGYRGESYRLEWPGRALATNLTGALALAMSFRVTAAQIHERLSSLTLEEGRLQFRSIADRLVLDDSYNSNPASLREALDVLARSPGPHSAILGDMRELGSLTREAHLEMGRATAGLQLVLAAGEFSGVVREANPAVIAVQDAAGVLPLLGRLPAGGTVLVKASRSLGFERIIAELQRLEQEAACR
jgi:UDP-N-acetylmuramoyl-tripeptide--D-alanyl-D-alanine ligase